MFKFAKYEKSPRVCLFPQIKQYDNLRLANCKVRVSTSFMSLLLAVRKSSVTIAFQKITVITSTQNLPLSPLR